MLIHCTFTQDKIDAMMLIDVDTGGGDRGVIYMGINQLLINVI
jgi:hypothetical protein